MGRPEMINALMMNAEVVIDMMIDYDPTPQERQTMLDQERARLEKKTDFELKNMVLLNCG